MTTYYTQQPQVPKFSRTAIAPFVAFDFGIGSNTATKTIAGYVYDVKGLTVSGATVVLYNQAGNFPCKVVTSDTSGHYSFTRDASDTNTYFVLAYSVVGGTTQIHGTSNRGLVPS